MATGEMHAKVIVFDLDDTLYKEVDYQTSGLLAVCRVLESVCGFSLESKFQELQQKSGSDMLGELCICAGVPINMKESMLWVYRLHEPAIKLHPDTAAMLNNLSKQYQLAILTDGRSITQRLKLRALGLMGLPVYISEEYQSVKPSALRFERVMRDFAAAEYVYVGDNLDKDFIAPKALGWRTVCLRDDGRNIHPQASAKRLPEQMPDEWVDDLKEIWGLLC
jgi:putative hydrolase of the HAD superfamily